MFPADNGWKHMHKLNLMEQIGQGFSNDYLHAHADFVKFCTFFNLILDTV